MRSDPLIQRIARATLPVAIPDGSDSPQRPGQRAASVLMPLVRRDREWRVIFTQRPETMPSHAGQISFPGGKREGGETSLAAALRETHEEIGISPVDIDVFARLPSFDAGNRFRVSPFIGIVKSHARIVPDPVEVADVFETPLAFLMDSDNHIPRDAEFDGRPERLWDMPWTDPDGVERHIWGMTAMMLYRLWERGWKDRAA